MIVVIYIKKSGAVKLVNLVDSIPYLGLRTLRCNITADNEAIQATHVY